MSEQERIARLIHDAWLRLDKAGLRAHPGARPLPDCSFEELSELSRAGFFACAIAVINDRECDKATVVLT